MTGQRLDTEEALIERYFAPLAAGVPGAFGLKDDCAVIEPDEGCDLVVTVDPIIEGVHFPAGEEPSAIAWRALAVNVSDLVAKGAAPKAYLLALALPALPQTTWMESFVSGLAHAQRAFGCRLTGGDTDRTSGPLTVSVTAFGMVPKGALVRRDTAKPGDVVYVTGTIGDATLGLKLRKDPALASSWGIDADQRLFLEMRFGKPAPPVNLAAALRDCASAAMDISDGLVKDFGRLCRASRIGGLIEATRVPVSPAAAAVLAAGGAPSFELLTGGDDYEVLATVPRSAAQAFERAAVAAGVTVTPIGETKDQRSGVLVVDGTGRTLDFDRTGWDHFSSRG